MCSILSLRMFYLIQFAESNLLHTMHANQYNYILVKLITQFTVIYTYAFTSNALVLAQISFFFLIISNNVNRPH